MVLFLPDPPYDCPAGYHLHLPSTACYRMNVDARLNYEQANNVCIREGATLASIEDRIEDSYLDCEQKLLMLSS